MRFPLFILSCASLLSQHVSAADTACSASQVKADVQTIKSQYTSPAFFCNYYISSLRVRSPLPSVSVPRMRKACECFINKRSSGYLVPSGSLPPGYQRKCISKDITAVRSEFKNVNDFCKYFTAIRARTGPLPIKSLSTNLQISDACLCILNPPKVSSSTKIPATSLRRSSAKSSSSTAKTTSTMGTTASSVGTTPSASSSTSTIVISTASSSSTILSSDATSPSASTSFSPTTSTGSTFITSTSTSTSTSSFAVPTTSASTTTADSTTTTTPSSMTTTTTITTTTTTTTATTTTTSAAPQQTCRDVTSNPYVSNGRTYDIHCDTGVAGYAGQGFSGFAYPNFHSCVDACATDSTCAGVNYYDVPPFGSNNCYMVDGAAQGANSDGSDSSLSCAIMR